MCKPKKKEEVKPCPNCTEGNGVVRSNYGARMMVNGKTKHLGYFLTVQDAERAYINYKETLSA
jgi:hypothetical protein